LALDLAGTEFDPVHTVRAVISFSVGIEKLLEWSKSHRRIQNVKLLFVAFGRLVVGFSENVTGGSLSAPLELKLDLIELVWREYQSLGELIIVVRR